MSVLSWHNFDNLGDASVAMKLGNEAFISKVQVGLIIRCHILEQLCFNGDSARFILVLGETG